MVRNREHHGATKLGPLYAFILCVAALSIVAAAGTVGPLARAPSRLSQSGSCAPGTYYIGAYNNTFAWTGGTLLSPAAVTWTGMLILYETMDTNCYVTDIDVRLTGPLNGGTLSITGNVFVSETVQFPSAFTDYANVATNAVGNLTSLSPSAGGYPP